MQLRPRVNGQEEIMDHDPVADDADAAVLDWETGLPPIKHEDLPKIVQHKVAAEVDAYSL